jgi:hypothetical protein
MDLVLKANGLFFIVTGGILTFYFANPMQPLVRFALLLPVVMSTAIAAVFAYGAHLSLQHRADVRDLASQLKFRVAPDVNAMRVLFWASAIVHALIATSLGIVVATAPPN